jgi:hypothetical protein
MDAKLAQKLAQTAINALSDFKGFEPWWHELDDQRRTNILDHLAQCLSNSFHKEVAS